MSRSMYLLRETLLFGIALIAFSYWVELDGFNGALYAYTGIALATIAFFGSVALTMRTTSTHGETAAKGEQS